LAEFAHVIVTRFNLPSAGVESLIRAKEGWLRDRVALFERYCLPSVLAQSSQFFNWIIYFDPETPGWLRERIEAHTEKRSYTPVFRTSVSPADLAADIDKITGRYGTRLITSSLDNDDALAVDFVERLQAAALRPGRMAVYLSRGLIKSGRRVYLRVDPTNAFPSVVEDWNSAVTCWADWHNLLGNHMPVLELHGDPGWLQVIHGTNVSNRVRGRLASPGEYTRLFPTLLDDVDTPSTAEELTDLMAGRPWRLARDSGRSLTKAIIMQLVGKDGLDRLKNLAAIGGDTRAAR
jgi:hypothetical protein